MAHPAARRSRTIRSRDCRSVSSNAWRQASPRPARPRRGRRPGASPSPPPPRRCRNAPRRRGASSHSRACTMNYLFIHQNCPAQYRHLVRHLADRPGNTVYFITQPNDNSMSGVYKVSYPKDERGPINCHAYSVEIDRAIYTGATVADVCRGLQEQGFRPDLIVGHAGWGETLFVKDVFPDVPLLANFEFYYHARGVDVDFDPEFVSVFNDPSRLRSRNATSLLAFEAADWGHSA